MAIFAKRPAAAHQPDERKIRDPKPSVSGRSIVLFMFVLVVGMVWFSYSGVVKPPLPESAKSAGKAWRVGLALLTFFCSQDTS